MSKGSNARPFSVKPEEFASNWDAIFKKPAAEPADEHGSELPTDGQLIEGQA